jgi:hypothetical protein
MPYARRSYSEIAVETTLVGTINDSALSFVLTDATGFPTGSGGNFYVRIEDETIDCESRVTTTVTVESGGRGALSTTAASHTAGVAVTLVFTSGDADEANYTVSQTVGKVTTAEDILVATGVNAFKRLAKGTDGQFLRMASGVLGYGSAASDSVDSDQIVDGAIDTAHIADDQVTYAKIQNVSATDRLLGRDTASAGNIEELTLDDTLEFTGSGGIQRAALTGDVTATAGSNTTAIAAGAVDTTELADEAVTAAKIDTTVAGAGLTGGAGTALTVVADDSTLEVSSDQVRIKADGVTNDELADDAVTVAKIGYEAWTSYVPVLSGTGWAIVNGTITGRYVQIGGTVHAKVHIAWGSGSTSGAGEPNITVPVAHAAGFTAYGRGEATDAAAFDYPLTWKVAASASGGPVSFMAGIETGVAAPVVRTTIDADSPFDPGASDTWGLSITYEAAS